MKKQPTNQSAEATASEATKPFSQPDKTLPKLTRKQQHFVDLLLSDKKISATESAMQAYNASNRNTAKSIAQENLTKPAIQSYLAKHSNTVEQVLLNTMTEWQDHEKPRQREIAIDVAKYVHDKIHGKAKQITEVQSSGVTLNIDLTGSVSASEAEASTQSN